MENTLENWLAGNCGAKAALGWRNGMRLDEAFQPEGESYQSAVNLIGPDNARIARRLWERESDYPYGYDQRLPIYTTRTFRTGRYGSLLFDSASRNLKRFVSSVRDGTFRMDALPDNPLTGESFAADENDYPAKRLGYFLDEHPDWERLLDVMLSNIEQARKESPEHPAIGRLTSGLLASKRPEAHAPVAARLTDAATPEGERFVILGCANRGTLPAFRALFAALREKAQMWMYSTLTRALSHWLGLRYETVEYTEGFRLVFETGGEFLANPEKVKKVAEFRAADTTCIYLWSLAQAEIGDAIDAAGEAIDCGDRRCCLGALHFAGGILDRSFQTRIAARALASEEYRRDVGVMALATQCVNRVYIPCEMGWDYFARPFFPHHDCDSAYRVRITDRADAHPFENDRHTLLAAREEVERLTGWLDDVGNRCFPDGAADRGAHIVAGDRLDVVMERQTVANIGGILRDALQKTDKDDAV